MWIKVAQFALQIAIMAVGKVSPAQWAQLGVVIQSWLQTIIEKLPVGHPLITMTSSFRAPLSKLQPPDKG
jgi:hypothetical protein